jgi:hypothetical protein
VSNLYIAVADNELQSALKILLERGFLEEPQTKLIDSAVSQGEGIP